MLWPPNFKKAICFLGSVFGTLGAIKVWTTWFDKVSTLVFILYALLCFLTYLCCVILNAAKWINKLKASIQKLQSENKKLYENNQGLIEQYNADLSEKEELLYNFRLSQAMLKVSNMYIDKKLAEKYEAHIITTKEIYKNERKSSQDNK